MRKAGPKGELTTINAADPLNLLGILTSEPRVPAITANRILLRDGLPVAALVAGEIKTLNGVNNIDEQMRQALVIGRMAPALRRYYA